MKGFYWKEGGVRKSLAKKYKGYLVPRNLLGCKRMAWVFYHTDVLVFLWEMWWLPCWDWPAAAARLLQSCLTLCDPKDCSPPGSSLHGVLQARILEWVAMPFSRESSPPRDRTHISWIGRWILYHWATMRSPIVQRSPILDSRFLISTSSSLSVFKNLCISILVLLQGDLTEKKGEIINLLI